jgi:hypothetical protein
LGSGFVQISMDYSTCLSLILLEESPGWVLGSCHRDPAQYWCPRRSKGARFPSSRRCLDPLNLPWHRSSKRRRGSGSFRRSSTINIRTGDIYNLTYQNSFRIGMWSDS